MIFKTAYFNIKAKTIINENEIIKSIQTSNQGILDGIAVWLSEGSGWTVESIDEQYINIIKYKENKKCDKEYIKNLDYTDATFPVAQKVYRKIEIMNRKIEIMNNINIIVFGYEKQEPYPVYISKEKFNMLNLLLITKEKDQHYVLIKDFNNFMNNQTKHRKKTVLYVLFAVFSL